jgi:bifunctional non-homologous end joining protein LigD
LRASASLRAGLASVGRKSPLVEVSPCLPKLVKLPPQGSRWIHELKYDGYRVLAYLDHGSVTLRTRNGLDWTHRFGNVPGSLRCLGVKTAVLDGEMTVPDEQSVSSFAHLQAALTGRRHSAFVYVLFDVVYVDGFDLRHAAQETRRRLLEDIFAACGAENLMLSEQFTAPPSRVLSEVCRLGMEGIVSKMLDSPYVSGRSSTWVKSKCNLSDDFYIVGYVPSSASSKAVGALALAHTPSGGVLSYAGRVGTGFSEQTARDLMAVLQPLRTGSSERLFPKPPDPGVTWVRPALIAEVTFTGWTRDGLLRHAVFKRIRDDK